MNVPAADSPGSLLWDNHGCMPLDQRSALFLPQLRRYRDAGVNVVSLNVGFDGVDWDNTIKVLARFRDWIDRHGEQLRLVESVTDVAKAKSEGKLGVTFDIEGGCALDGELALISLYYALGVRWMGIAYNRNNSLGGGCQDDDPGLTEFGRKVVDEMARVGMVVCCSHTGLWTSLDVMQHSPNPVIFSHSNPAGVWRHKRNICDQAIRACAATGGVVGINGIGIFLGQNDTRTETVLRHIDYVAQMVGVAHVGLALDYVFDASEIDRYVAQNPKMFPPSEGYAAGGAMVTPEQIPEIALGLGQMGYRPEDVSLVLGGNHLRMARTVWR